MITTRNHTLGALLESKPVFAKKLDIPSNLKNFTGQEMPPITAVTDHYAETIVGQNLKSNVRYDRYKPKHLSNKQWIKLLGADVCNFTHLRLTYGLARQFVRNSPNCNVNGSIDLNDEQMEVLFLAADTHDLAEGVVGDITYDEKTDEHERREKTVMRELLSKQTAISLQDQQVEQLLGTIFEKTTKLGKIFNLIEKVGYMRTALNAWRAFHQHPEKLESVDPKISTSVKENQKLLWLTIDVLTNQIGALIANSEKFPVIEEYLWANRQIITEIMLANPEAAYQFYPPAKRLEKENQFQQAYVEWIKFINTFAP